MALQECRQPDPTMEYFCPILRYCPWESQVPETTSWLVENLGYDQSSWNYDGSVNDIESLTFSELDLMVQSNLEVLGFDEDAHDCCHNQ